MSRNMLRNYYIWFRSKCSRLFSQCLCDCHRNEKQKKEKMGLFLTPEISNSKSSSLGHM